MVNVVNLVGVKPGLIDGRVRRSLDHSEDHALVLGRRQLALREHVERDHQHGDDGPQSEHNRPIVQRRGESTFVGAADTVEAPVDPAGEAALGVSCAQQLRSHHRRKRQRHDSGDDHSSCERERELPEQRSGQAALNTDRGIHCRQRDGHRDDRADQFTRGIDSGAVRESCPTECAARRFRP